MAKDFREMAAGVRREHDEAEAAKKKQREEQQQAELYAVQEAINILATNVRPILEEAKNGFAGESIEFDIKEKFETKTLRHRKPALEAVFLSHPRASDGYQIKTAAAFFDCDSKSIRAGLSRQQFVGDEPVNWSRSVPVGQHQALVEEYLESALRQHLKRLEEVPWKSM